MWLREENIHFVSALWWGQVSVIMKTWDDTHDDLDGEYDRDNRSI